MTTIEAIHPLHEELIAIRRDLHAHPEIGFEEHRTSDLVATLLAEWGIEVHRNIGGTGIVGVLRRGNGQASIGLRADMDALPIHESTGQPYASNNPGVMHACGHDGHTTMLLGAAKYLAQSGDFNGTVNFIFQPAEEGLGGASAMLEAGLFERFPCDRIYGMHNRPGLPVGKFIIRPGAMMAGGGFFDIKITGHGGHAARPEAATDPILAASAIVGALQSIISRNLPPAEPAVLSVTALNAGSAYNVIPESALIRGTARAFNRETLNLIETAIRRIATQTAAAYGAKAELDFRILFAPLINDGSATDSIADAADALVGAENVNRQGEAVMGSEDFSFMLESRPGAYINLGNGESSAPLHNDRYDFNDEALPYGVALYAQLAEQSLPRLVA
jgi:hippurate hydrolase